MLKQLIKLAIIVILAFWIISILTPLIALPVILWELIKLLVVVWAVLELLKVF